MNTRWVSASPARLRALLLSVLGVLGLGCTSLVEKHPARLRCAMTVVNACPNGLVCVGGYCASEGCDPVPELCGDGVDNDCDGEVDEPDVSASELCGDGVDNDCDGEVDEGFDVDGDGHLWCGDIRGSRDTADCDDLNPTVYVGAPEICDGYDNDCNRAVDDAPAGGALCPAGEECLGRCIKPSCAIAGSSAACDEDERCDADTGSCVPRFCGGMTCLNGQYCDPATTLCRALSLGNGEACAADADCVSGLCIEAAAVGLAQAAVSVCGEACCRDGECGENELCFAPGNGARSCLPSAFVATLTPVAASCSAATECDGGYCSPLVFRGRGGRVGNAGDGFVTTGCVASTGAQLKLAEFCTAHGECASGLCLRNSLFGSPGVCSEPCGSSSDCNAFETAVFAGLVGDAYCRTLPTEVDASHRGHVPTCVLDPRSSSGGKLGAACSAGSECEDGVCAATRDGSRCAPACCNDSDCRVDGLAGSCRPLTFGDHYEMRCVL